MIRYLTVPSSREAPADVLRVLREVVPRLDIHWCPDRIEWIVCRIADVPTARLHEAMKMAASVAARDGSFRATLRRIALMREGASALGFYTERDITSPSWLRDNLQYLVGRSDKEIEQQVADDIDTAEGLKREVRRIQVIRDYTATDGRLVSKVLVKGRTPMSFNRPLTRIRSSVRQFFGAST